MPEAVVCRPLIGIRQDGVGFAALLEFLFRIGIIRIAVRMELQRHLAVGAFDLLVASFAGNPEHFVVVAFYVAGQNGSKSFRISCGLVLRVARDSNHRGAQQAILQLVAALQLFQYLMICSLGCIHHLDRLVKMRVKKFAFCRDGAQPQFR